MKFAIASLLLVLCLNPVFSKDRNDKPYKVVCYYESWADYDKGQAKFDAEDINPNVCTHINYSFAKLQNNEITLEDADLDGSGSGHQNMIKRTVALRQHNPHLTVMISIGGWGEGSTKYSQMAATAANRKHFVDSAVKFLQQYDLDGLDIDWEYPGTTSVGSGDRKPGNPEDKQNYVHLLQELSEAFKPHGFLLSAAVAAGTGEADKAYDIPNGLNKYLDFINLMTYDYHGEWDGATGYNAPLSTGGDNIHITVDYWLKKGADSKKLILGIPLYGKAYTITGTDHKLGAKATAAEKDSGNYNKICAAIKAGGWTVHFDDQAGVPYATKGNEWISFDNAQSVQKKLDYVIEKKLGGSMVWAIDGDDFHGACGDGKYPLMKLQMKALNKVDAADVTIPKPKPA